MNKNFLGHYDKWRDVRIRKIIKELGEDFFRGKSLLELGCGYGHIGKYFIDNFDCDVTFAEGRIDHVNLLKKETSYEVICLNQEKEYTLDKKYDIIIHWGVLYHLDNWKQDLKCAISHLNSNGYLFLETEVCDSDDENFEVKIKERSHNYDQSMSGIGSRPSAPMIENVLVENGLQFSRYDDDDISPETFKGYPHVYNWKVENTGRTKPGLRRFWISKK